jgi:hypothetical protein
MTFENPVDGGARHPEQFGDGVAAGRVRLHRVGCWRAVSLGCLPRSLPLALAIVLVSDYCTAGQVGLVSVSGCCQAEGSEV